MAGIDFSQQWLDALGAYAQGLQASTEATAERASQYLHNSVVDRARADPDWVNLADQIEMWSEDGRLVIGIRRREYQSQAFALEYGDETRPPNPLFRTLTGEARATGDLMREDMAAEYGPGR